MYRKELAFLRKIEKITYGAGNSDIWHNSKLKDIYWLVQERKEQVLKAEEKMK